MLSNFRHSAANVGIRRQQGVMLGRVPFQEGRQLLRDGLEQTNHHAHWSGFHIVAEFVDGGVVRDPEVAIELHAFPHRQQD